jgi:MOSC domain-containing protein
MAVIAGLNFYPVKGCKGIGVQQATLVETGLLHDRHWMVVDASGRFVTQRESPRMALISTSIDASALTLTAPGMPELRVPPVPPGATLSVTVWRDTCSGIDQGASAAAWLSTFLGQELRLVRFDSSKRRRSDPQYTDEHDTHTEFADAFAVLVISEASLADLNSRLEVPVPMNRFRPNIVIAGVDAYDEDHLLALGNGRVELRIVKPCTRCPVTTTNQDTAEVGIEPLRTLQTYRQHPVMGSATFGQNAIVVRGAGSILRVGDALEETWNF